MTASTRTPRRAADLPDASGHVLGTAEHPVVLVERDLDATPAEVWDAWTDPERLVRWLGAVSGPLGATGPVRVAMTSAELPAAGAGDVHGLAVFTVAAAEPPTADRPGRLVFGFADPSDPDGVVTVTMSALDADRCRLRLEHAISAAGAHEASGFGAGWEGFVDWLEDALADRPHPQDDTDGTGRYEQMTPHYDAAVARLAASAGTLTSTAEGATVRHERSVSAAPQAVWDLLTSAQGLPRWLGTLTSGVLGPGAAVEVVHDGADPVGSRQVSEVTTWEPPHRLAMTWSYPGETTSALEIALEPDGAAVRLVLEHRALPTALGDDYLAGWHAHLDLLVAVAEGAVPPPFDRALAAVRRP